MPDNDWLKEAIPLDTAPTAPDVSLAPAGGNDWLKNAIPLGNSATPSAPTGIYAPIKNYTTLKYLGGNGRGTSYAPLLQDIHKAAEGLGLTLGISSAYRPGAVTTSGHTSRHASQHAVDISTINGFPVTDPQGKALGDMLAARLKSMGFETGEHGTNRGLLWQTNVGGNHFNHLHVSYPSSATIPPGAMGMIPGVAGALTAPAKKPVPLPAQALQMVPGIAGALATPIKDTSPTTGEGMGDVKAAEYTPMRRIAPQTLRVSAAMAGMSPADYKKAVMKEGLASVERKTQERMQQIQAGREAESDSGINTPFALGAFPSLGDISKAIGGLLTGAKTWQDAPSTIPAIGELAGRATGVKGTGQQWGQYAGDMGAAGAPIPLPGVLPKGMNLVPPGVQEALQRIGLGAETTAGSFIDPESLVMMGVLAPVSKPLAAAGEKVAAMGAQAGRSRAQEIALKVAGQALTHGQTIPFAEQAIQGAVKDAREGRPYEALGSLVAFFGPMAVVSHIQNVAKEHPNLISPEEGAKFYNQAFQSAKSVPAAADAATEMSMIRGLQKATANQKTTPPTFRNAEQYNMPTPAETPPAPAAQEPPATPLPATETGATPPNVSQPVTPVETPTVSAFNPVAEQNALMEKSGQQSVPREGVTRDQIARMFARQQAAKAANALKYKDGTNAYSRITDLLNAGGKIEQRPGGYVIVEPGGSEVPFRRKAEMDFLKVAGNIGDFARNYDVPKGEPTNAPVPQERIQGAGTQDVRPGEAGEGVTGGRQGQSGGNQEGVQVPAGTQAQTPQEVAPTPLGATERVPTPEKVSEPIPATEAPTEVKPVPSDVTGVAKAVTGREPQKGVSREEMLQTGRDRINAGIVPRDVAQETLDTGKPMSDEDLAAVGVRLRDVANQRAEIAGLIDKMGKDTDPVTMADLQKKLSALDGETELLLSASDLSLNKGFHRLGMAAQLALDRSYNLVDLGQRAKAANGGEALSKEMQAKVDQFQAENNRLAAELKAAKEALEKQLAATAKQAPTEARTRNAKRDIDRLQKYFGTIPGQVEPTGARLGRQSGAVTYTLPKPDMEAMQAIRRLARDEMAAGAKDLDEVMNGIRQKIGRNVPDETLLRMMSDSYRQYMLEADVNRKKAQGYVSELQRAAEYRQRTLVSKALKAAGDLFSTTQRGLEAGLDLSAPFIQGRKGLAANPTGWVRSWVPMMKAALRGEDVAAAQLADIQRHPLYSRAVAAKLDLTEPGGKFTAQEEMFAGNLIHYLIEKMPGNAATNPLKLYLKGIEHSEAAYTAFLNGLRWDTFTKLASVAPDNPAYLRDVAGTINTIYGRGAGKTAQMAGQSRLAGNLIYAPRYAISQWEWRLGRPLWKAETTAGQRQALKIYAAEAAAYAGLVGMARLAGWNVGTDPRQTDFGKVEIPGVGKVDLFAKEAQVYRFVTQLAAGKISESGKYNPPGRRTGIDVFGSYLINKGAPLTKNLSELAWGKMVSRQGETTTRELQARDIAWGFAPLWVQQGVEDGTFGKMPTTAIQFLGEDVSQGKLSKTRYPMESAAGARAAVMARKAAKVLRSGAGSIKPSTSFKSPFPGG